MSKGAIASFARCFEFFALHPTTDMSILKRLFVIIIRIVILVWMPVNIVLVYGMTQLQMSDRVLLMTAYVMLTTLETVFVVATYANTLSSSDSAFRYEDVVAALDAVDAELRSHGGVTPLDRRSQLDVGAQRFVAAAVVVNLLLHATPYRDYSEVPVNYSFYPMLVLYGSYFVLNWVWSHWLTTLFVAVATRFRRVNGLLSELVDRRSILTCENIQVLNELKNLHCQLCEVIDKIVLRTSSLILINISTQLSIFMFQNYLRFNEILVGAECDESNSNPSCYIFFIPMLVSVFYGEQCIMEGRNFVNILCRASANSQDVRFLRYVNTMTIQVSERPRVLSIHGIFNYSPCFIASAMFTAVANALVLADFRSSTAQMNH